ncbi:glycosyl transferase [Desulfosarcina sp.]|uniref:glycosyl transferase n=1 Tax=Desulfosarcina sp. TaxID=2027861 RepID=UPI0039710520
MTIEPIIYFSFSLGLAALLTPIVRQVALNRGWMAHPSSDRWHKKSTALMGGIAIFIAMAVPLLFVGDLETVFKHTFKADATGGVPSAGAVILLGTAFLFAVGLFDDFRSIKPHNKLIAQILAAALVVFLGFRLHWFTSLTLDTMVTLLWIVGITNAFNLIDNMDGLCAGVGLVACVALAVLFHPLAREPFLVALVLAGALGGFLFYNFNPAKIFMGDCGSLVIGFSISVLALGYAETPSSTPFMRFAVPILMLLVPILDTTLVTAIRLLSGRKASTGGRDHTSHRLVLMGFSEKSAVLFLYGTGCAAGLAAVIVSRSDSLTSPVVIVPVVTAIALMGIYLSQLRVYPEKEFSVLRNRQFTPVLLELTYKRQLLLVMLDLVLVAFSYYLAYRLRFDGPVFAYYFKVFLNSLPAVIACKLLVFYAMGIYRGMWGYLSTNDVFLYVRASFAGTLVSVAAVTLIYRFEDFSKGIFFIDALLTTGLLLGVRGSFRLFIETQNRKTLSGDNVVIYGAGRGGELLLREILNNKRLNVKPVGFVDDDVLKKGKKIQGYPILGTLAEMDRIHSQHQVGGVLVSFDDADGRNRPSHAAVEDYCRRRGLFLKRFRIDLKEVDLKA